MTIQPINKLPNENMAVFLFSIFGVLLITGVSDYIMMITKYHGNHTDFIHIEYLVNSTGKLSKYFNNFFPQKISFFVLMILTFLLLYYLTDFNKKTLTIFSGLFVGGGFSNALLMILFGRVVDFICIGNYVFNVGDISMQIGAIGFIYLFMKQPNN